MAVTDTVAKKAWRVRNVAISNGVNGTQIDTSPLPERCALQLAAHATETIFVGDSATTCFYPILPASGAFAAAMGHELPLFARATGVIAAQPLIELA